MRIFFYYLELNRKYLRYNNNVQNKFKASFKYNNKLNYHVTVISHEFH